MKFSAQQVDLHTHSTASDGILKPIELVSRAVSQGVNLLALTDHDTLAGLEEARAEAKRQNIRLISGIEFSGLWGGRTIHVLGLNVDEDKLQGAVQQQTLNRETRSLKIAERLAKKGFQGALAGAQKHADGGVIGRPHFARWMIEMGHVKDFKEAFRKYLGAGKPGDVKQMWPELAQIVTWIVAAQGVAVMAHPHHYKMTRTKLKALLTDFQQAGGEAMEVCSGPQDANTTTNLAQLCREYGFLASCGSDFHSPASPWQELGRYPHLPSDLAPVWEQF